MRQRSSILFAMLASLAGCTEGSSPAAPGVGAKLYDGSCAACHQQTALGIPGVYPALSGSPVVLGDPGVLARWVIKGVRPASLPMGRYPSAMPQFGWMKPAAAAALFTYLRSNFGNHAPAVEPAAVAAALVD
jgi:mono/diheme cytochrome c family protein